MAWMLRAGSGAGLAIVVAATASAHAQVSLRTMVELAQRNSNPVRAAQADVNKAQAVLSESKDVYVPSLSFSTGIPAFPEVGFTGQPPSLYSATIQSLVFSIPQKYYIDAARSGIQAANTRLKDAREQVALDASDGIHRTGHGEPRIGSGAGGRKISRQSWSRSSSSEPRREWIRCTTCWRQS